MWGHLHTEISARECVRCKAFLLKTAVADHRLCSHLLLKHHWYCLTALLFFFVCWFFLLLAEHHDRKDSSC